MTTSTNHQLQITVSKDGGHDFVSATDHDLGTTGAFVKRVIRTRLGQARQFSFKVEVSSPIKCPILAASIQAESES